MTIRKIENETLTIKTNTVGAGFACPDTLTDAYADVFRAGRPRPYRFNY